MTLLPQTALHVREGSAHRTIAFCIHIQMYKVHTVGFYLWYVLLLSQQQASCLIVTFACCVSSYFFNLLVWFFFCSAIEILPPTFITRNRQEVLDIKLVSKELINKITNWRVLEEHSISDHR